MAEYLIQQREMNGLHLHMNIIALGKCSTLLTVYSEFYANDSA
ncbi:MAG TPA: hypothetical protein V6D10_19305 [Trichocoleus sp.]